MAPASSGPAGRPSALRRAALEAQRLLARPTAASRPLPDYLIIGAQKAGTTSLHAWLEAHPAGLRVRGKELHFFDLRYGRGLDWYRSCFPRASARRHVSDRVGAAVAGEATPAYLFHPEVPARVAADLPGVRCVAVLREPVARAHSHWRHERRAGREDRSFVDAVRGELDLLAAGRGATPDDPLFRRRWYLSRGHYAEQLGRWFAHVGREPVLVLRSETMFEHPGATFATVCDHLGISRWEPPEGFEARNRDLAAIGVGDDLDPDLAQALADHFAPHNQALGVLLGDAVAW